MRFAGTAGLRKKHNLSRFRRRLKASLNFEMLEPRQLLAGDSSIRAHVTAPGFVEGIDVGFGTAGVSSGLPFNNVGLGMTTLPSGDILVANSSNNGDVSLSRYSSQGVLDSSFGTAGVLPTIIDKSWGINKVQFFEDGSFIGVGNYFGDASLNQLSFVHVGADGEFDPAFSDVIVVPNFGNPVDIATDAVGSITVFCEFGTDEDGNQGPGIIRFTQDGELDTTFSDDGLFVFVDNPDIEGSAGLVQSDGKLLIGGTDNSNGMRFWISRLNSDGTLDEDFGDGGEVLTQFPGFVESSLAELAQRPDGSLVAIGEAFTYDIAAPIREFAIASYDADGQLETSFGINGLKTIGFGGDQVTASNAVVDLDKLLIGATRYEANTANNEAVLMRLKRDGTLDTTFGGTGIQSFDFGIHRNYVAEIAIQPNGKLLGLVTKSQSETFGSAALVRLGGNYITTVNRPMTLAVEYTDSSTSQSHTVQWQITDGSNQILASGSGATINFVPTQAGRYTVTVSVTNSLGDHTTETAFITATLPPVTASLSGGVLSIQSSASPQFGASTGATINVRQVNGTISIDGVSTTFSSALVQSIQINGSAGDDFIYTNSEATSGQEPISPPITVYGNDGDDVIVFGRSKLAAPFSHIAYGGNGNDELFAGSEGDKLFGEAGDDRLTGGAGNDWLVGGTGIDTVIATSDTNMVLTNTQLTGHGNDLIQDVEKARLTGGAGNNTLDASAFSGPVALVGNDGDDILIGGQSDDLLSGGQGFDRLVASGNVNFTLSDGALFGLGTDFHSSIEAATLNGGAGNNTIDASQFQGSVTLSGGAGNDTLIGGHGENELFETADVDFVLTSTSLTGLGTDQLVGIESATLRGGAGNNNITVSGIWRGVVTVYGNAGNDTLKVSSFFGTNIVYGGPGDDWIEGTGGSPLSAFGEDGDDRLIGGSLGDSLFGGAGSDTITGSGDDDAIDGGAGTDTIIESGDSFTLTNSKLVGFGTDSLASIERAELSGNAFNDVIDASGFSGNATLVGGDGNDTLIGGAGDDTLSGGLGNDTLDGRGGSDTVSESGNIDFRLTNTSLIELSQTGYGQDQLLRIEVGRLSGGTRGVVLDASTFSGTAILQASSSGNSILRGGSGNDTLRGGLGSAEMSGGAGNDAFFGSTRDLLVESADVNFNLTATRLTGLGTDTIAGITQIELSGGKSKNVIDAHLFGGTVSIFGGAGDDQLIGGTGVSYVYGGAGNDTLISSGGTSTSLYGEDGNDTLETRSVVSVLLDGGTGSDKLNAGGDQKMLIQKRANSNLEYLLAYGPNTATVLTASMLTRSIEEMLLEGGAGANVIDARAYPFRVTINGGAGNDTLYGGIGNDTLNGGPGNDLIFGDAGNDVIDGNAGNDSISGEAGNDTLFGSDGDDTISGGTGNDQIQGGNGADSLGGDAGNDLIFGGADSDTLFGNDGDDYLSGGYGPDQQSPIGATTSLTAGLEMIHYLAVQDVIHQRRRWR